MKNLLKAIKLLPLLIFISVLSSCKTDLNVNAPYKDTPVVYGLLNQNDSIHYVKITKAFLGQADAYQMAQIRDSSEYADVLDVKIMETNKGTVLRTFNLQRTLIKNKSQGTFYSPEHYVYAFPTPNQPLKPEYKYELKVINNELDMEISSETDLVHPFTIKKPTEAPQASISFYSINNVSDYSIEWISAVNAKRYNILVVFNYKEVDKTANDTITRKIEWVYNFKSKTIRGGEEMAFNMTGNEFFGKIAQNIPNAASNIERLVHTMDFYFSVAGEELNTYMEVNEPVTGIVQEKPEYTNIVNGIGIFSSRLNKAVQNKGLTQQTARNLKRSEETKDKGFIKYWDPVNNQYLCIDLNPVTNACD